MVLTACQACNVDLNLQTRDGGNTLLHIAARRPGLPENESFFFPKVFFFG